MPTSNEQQARTQAHSKSSAHYEPSIVKVLRMVDGDVKPSMAFLYGDI
jgi:hypothetical protein